MNAAAPREDTGVVAKLAEGVGFEPTDGLPRLLISSQVPLTTQPPFRAFICKGFMRFLKNPVDFYSLIL